MGQEFAVKTKGLGKAFDGKEVIHNCTMSVEKGTIYGFLGKNGAGKPRFLNSCWGFCIHFLEKAR